MTTNAKGTMAFGWQATVGGALFGLLFPLGALTFDCLRQGLPLTWASVGPSITPTPYIGSSTWCLSRVIVQESRLLFLVVSDSSIRDRVWFESGTTKLGVQRRSSHFDPIAERIVLVSIRLLLPQIWSVRGHFD